jgi:glycolate oxidase iron-sulfur subunit
MASRIAVLPDLEPARKSLLIDQYDNMLACVRCGLCLTACPTYVLSLNEAEAPRGRIAIARALAEGHLQVTPDLVEHEQNCLVCEACTAVCPAGVHMDPLQVSLRAAIEPNLRRPTWQRLLRRVVFRGFFADMGRFRALARALWLYQRSGVQALARATSMLKLLGLERRERLLPRVATHFLVPRGECYARERGAGSNPADRVAFFAGCVMSTALADVDRATIRVLQRAGCDVENTARQGCCGALNAHSGDLDGALELARRNIAAFESSQGAIVVNAAGCGAMLKEYTHHLQHDHAWAERARSFSARVRDVTEFLATRALPMRRPVAKRVVYQDACHLLHAQRISHQPRALLQAVEGLELREMAENGLCCGSAGVYNVTNPRQAHQLQHRKLDNALATEPELIVTANPGCLIQLRSGLEERGSSVSVKHLVELLDEASAP